MTKEEAIKILKSKMDGKTDTSYEWAETVRMAISALSENKGEWIPVSERLPEKNMPCLVAVGQFNLTQMAVYSDLMGTIDHRIFYQGDYGKGNFDDITEYVKAWQPLPEPYKAESEDIERMNDLSLLEKLKNTVKDLDNYVDEKMSLEDEKWSCYATGVYYVVIKLNDIIEEYESYTDDGEKE